jgi:hypothetical protein
LKWSFAWLSTDFQFVSVGVISRKAVSPQRGQANSIAGNKSITRVRRGNAASSVYLSLPSRTSFMRLNFTHRRFFPQPIVIGNAFGMAERAGFDLARARADGWRLSLRNG